MNVIQIFSFILLLHSLNLLIIDPTCKDCLQTQNQPVENIYFNNKNTYLNVFTLPGFSQATILVDLRHFLQFPQINNKTVFSLYFTLTDSNLKNSDQNQISDLIIGTNQYTISTTAQIKLYIYFQIIQNQQAYQYLLRQSVSLKLTYSNDRIPNEDSSYVFIVTSQDNINLPKNKPNLENPKKYYLENQRIDSELTSQITYSQSTSYWKTEQKFVIPYFPYFANCQNDHQGNMIQIMQLLQNQTSCKLIPISQTIYINQFTFGSSAVADHCLVKLNCMHKGDVINGQYPQWQTLPVDSLLFSISQQKISWNQYQINMEINQDDLVECKINTSEGSNSSDVYPLKVKVTMGYYQVTQVQKRIIKCDIDYSLYVDSKANFSYQLQIQSYPLNHTYIMLSFGFNWYVYMIIFIMIGLISNIQHFILWIYHYWIAEVKKPLRIKIYLRIIKEMIIGTMLAVSLLVISLVVVCIFMNGKLFDFTFYQTSETGSTTPRVFWDYILENQTSNYDSAEVSNLRSGRMGLAFAIIGVFIILITCKYFIGKQKQIDQYKDYDILGRVFRPFQWNKSKFLFGTFITIIIQFFLIYIGYSSLYSQNIWTFIVLTKLFQMVMQEIIKSVYQDALPCLPLKILTQITAYLNTLSADDFYDFLFSFLVDVAMTMIQKAYVSQLQNIVVDKIKQKSEQLNKFYLNLMNDSQEQIQQQANINENQQNNDNQRVFIPRQSQQVQFFQEQIKQIYSIQNDQTLITADIETVQQIKIKKKYFQALSKQYQKQRELLLKDNNKPGMLMQEQKIKNYNNGANGAGEEDQQEIIERETMIFQFLVDNIALIYTFFIQPFIVFTLWMTYDQSAILSEYGISYNTVVLYNLSAIVIALFSIINAILIFHILESYMDISFLEQITNLLERFFKRKVFWKADDADLNMNIDDQLRGADHYCLSSQFFFILTIYLVAMILVMLGFSIMFKTNYNLFDDIASLPIILFWLLLLFSFQWVCQKLVKFFNIWQYRSFQKQTNDSQGKNYKPFGIKDSSNTDQSSLKTQNILFVDDFMEKNLIIMNDSNKSIKETKNNSQKEFKLFIENNEKRKKKNKIENMNLKIQNFDAKDQIILAHKRLQTICKKLQPLFMKDSFKMQYSLKNKIFIQNNIEKILPLVDFLPELQEYKNIQSSENKSKQQQHNKKLQTKNMQPGIAQLILSWFRTTQKQKQFRIMNGLQYQSKKKKCSFCYSTWGLYYGYGGICLECSLRMMRNRNQNAQQNPQKDKRNSKLSDQHQLNALSKAYQDKYDFPIVQNNKNGKFHKD